MTTKKGVTKLLALRRRLRANQTSAEQLLWLKLRSKQIHGLKFRRQHEIGSYIVDFFCPERNLVIEIDGDVHATETHQINDLEREKHLKSLGLQKENPKKLISILLGNIFKTCLRIPYRVSFMTGRR
jgi:very-short-patch-repair endonuclease